MRSHAGACEIHDVAYVHSHVRVCVRTCVREPAYVGQHAYASALVPAIERAWPIVCACVDACARSRAGKLAAHMPASAHPQSQQCVRARARL
eukprot:3084046-Pleurochrysis_carterae.AAC.1